MLSQGGDLKAEGFDLVFTVKEAALDGVFLTTDHGHLMLDVREVPSLFL